MSTRADKKAEARDKAKKIQAQEKRRSRRNKILTTVGILALVALVAFAVSIIVKDGHEKQATGQTSSDDWATFTRADSVFGDELPNNVNDQGGISLGSDMVAGSVNEEAPVVSIYYDYMCSWCNYLEYSYTEDLAQMAQEGDITLVYQPVAVLGEHFSAQAMAAEYFVAENAPEKYAEFHDALFLTVYPVFLNEDYDGEQPSLENITATAAVIGLSDDMVEDLTDAVNEGAYDDAIESANRQWAENGQEGTPGVVIDDRQLTDWTEGKLIEHAQNAVSNAK